MAEKAARVRLMLNAGGFIGGLDQATAKVGRFGSKMRDALAGPMKAGMASAKTELASMGNELKSALRTASTLGGALSVGAGIKGGVELTSTYRQMAFNIEAATGKAASFAAIQRDVEKAAAQTKRTSEELAEGWKAVAERSGDPGFALENLATIGHAMNATGRSAGELGEIVGTLKRKFGMSTEEVPSALATIIELTSKGTVKFEELSEDLNELGSNALQAGLKGSDGFQKMIGMVAGVAPKVKGMSETLAGLDIVLERLRDPAILQRVAKEAGTKLGADFEKLPDAISRMRHLLGKGEKMRVLLKTEFPGREEKAAFDVLADPFEKAYQEAKRSGAKTKEATQAGLKAFDDAVGRMGESSLTGARLFDESAKRMKNDPMAALRTAMETFAKEFTKPAMMDAVNDLAQDLPKVARAAAKLVSLTVNNPALAAGGYVGGRVGLAFLSGSLRGEGSKMGNEVGEAATKHSGWSTVGKGIGIAAAAAFAYEAGKALIDAAYKERGESEGKSYMTEARAEAALGRGKSLKQKEAAYKAVRQQLAKRSGEGTGYLEAATSGALEASQFAAKPLAALGKFLGLGTQVVNREGKVIEPDSPKTAGQRLQDELTALRTKEIRLAGEIREMRASGAEGGMDEAKIGTAAAAGMGKQTLNVRVVSLPSGGGGGRGTNGLPPAQGNQPGSTPR